MLQRLERLIKIGGTAAGWCNQNSGIRSNRKASLKCGAQAGAERVQISTVGSIQDLSSIVPAFRNATSGSDSIVLNIGEPQAEQNRRSVLLS
jgi:hypothetical protein